VSLLLPLLLSLLLLQIFQPSAEMLAGWKPSEPVRYAGGHGMKQ
jgi:hypothetical protein